MDVTQPLLRAAQGGARTRLLVDDRVVVVDAQGGTEPVARATPAYGDGPGNLGPRRDKPHTLPLTPPATLFGRADELDQLNDALDAGDTAVLSAAPGLGKTALLHHLGTERAKQHPDGAVLLSARGRTPEDLLFEVFRAFYEVPGRRPGPDDLRRHLTAIKALILVDDVADPARLARALADNAPHSRVVLATEAERTGRDAFTELVAGLEPRDGELGELVAGVAFGEALAIHDEDEGISDEEEIFEAELVDEDEDESEDEGEQPEELADEPEASDEPEARDEPEVRDEPESRAARDIREETAEDWAAEFLTSEDLDEDLDDEDDDADGDESGDKPTDTADTKSAKPAEGSGDDD